MEEVKQIGTISRSSLTNSAHVSMNTEISQMLAPLTVAYSKVSTLQKEHAAYLSLELDSVNNVTKSASTEVLVALDAKRDQTFRFIAAIISAYTLCPDEAHCMEGKLLDAIMSAYRQADRKSYSEETAIIDGLLKDMAASDPDTAIKALKLETYFETLKEQNDDYKNQDRTRTDEYAARLQAETKAKREATDTALDNIVRHVNALQELQPDALLASFIDTVNQVFKKYSNLISAKSGHRKNDDKPIV